jgi:Beta-propeller repeat/Abnormal spindle-like microcephaly-assoc'd, ASPM-SPD-2-Hydin
MGAAIHRRCWALPLLGYTFLLAFACLALGSQQFWSNSSSASLPTHVFGLLGPNGISSTLHPPQIPQRPVIDPVLVYSTFLGGASLSAGEAPNLNNGGGGAPFYQGATAIYVDPSGNLYVVGATSADDFPVTSGVIQPVNSNNNFVGFLSKIDPSGHLLFSTYLDGMSAAAAIVIDTTGNIYVAGINPAAPQPPLPIPAGTTPFNPTPRSISIVKLNSTATSILNATYLGGSAVDLVTGLALDSSGNVYIAGSTTSNDFPTMNPLQPSLGASGKNVFVTKMNSSLSSLIYSTYLGLDSSAIGAGSQSPTGTASHGIAVDTSGDAYVVGMANSGFPVTAGAIVPSCTSACPFMAKLNPSGSSLLYSTLLVGTAASSVFVSAVAVDTSQNVFLAGAVATPGFPEVNSVEPCPAPAMLQGQRTDGSGFVSEISAAGALAFSTCLGDFLNPVGIPDYGINDLVLNSSGNVYVVGFGNPLLVNPIQANSSAGALFVAAIDPRTPSLLFSSYLAGVQSGTPPNGAATGVGVDATENIYAAGIVFNAFNTTQPPLPVFNALQPVAGLAAPAPLGCSACKVADAFALKIAPTDAAAAALFPALVTFPVQAVGTPSTAVPVTIIDMGSTALAVSNATATGDFSLQNNCSAVSAAGGTCTIQVTFTPTVSGTRTGTLTIADSSAGSPRTVQLTGEGGQGSAAFSPSSLSFGNQQISASSTPQTITLTNTGALALQISHIQASSSFDETNNCGNSLAANTSCIVSITFTPTTEGQVIGTVTFTDTAPDSPQTLSLTGTGTGATQGQPPSIGLGLPSGGSGSATVTAGATATYTLAIGGAGMTGTASLTCTGAPTGATCSVPATVPTQASTASTFYASITTTAGSNVWFFPSGPAPWLWVIAFLGCLALWKTASTQTFPRLRLRFAPLLALALCACGGGSTIPPPIAKPNPNATPAGTYTIVVTAKSGATMQTQNLTLTVQ